MCDAGLDQISSSQVKSTIVNGGAFRGCVCVGSGVHMEDTAGQAEWGVGRGATVGTMVG